MIQPKSPRFKKYAIISFAAVIGVAIIMLLNSPKQSDELSTTVDLDDFEQEPRVLDMGFEPTEDITEEMLAKDNAIIQDI